MRIPPRARPREINYPFLDRFTLVHFLIGMAYGAMGWAFSTALVLAVFWELIENPLKAYLPFIFPHATADTLKNSAGDVIAVICGWLLAQELFSGKTFF